MAEIATTDAYGLFTKYLVAVYKERMRPTNFLRSFFTEKETPTKELSIMVQRGDEWVAADVARGTEGNRNDWKWSTEKLFIPPYFNEFFDFTQLQLYDRLFGVTQIEESMFAALINDAADKTVQIREMIERAIEVQCAQIFQSGIVELINGTNINYHRKAGSMVDPGAGQYFANAIDPFALFEAGAGFIRKEGKAPDGTYNAILGEGAMADLQKNAQFIERQKTFNMKLDNVIGPQRDQNTGAVYHGRITAGSYEVQLWTYPQFYKKKGTTDLLPYIDSGLVCMVPPSNNRFEIGYAAVPQLLKPGQPVRQGKFIISEYTNEEYKTHKIKVESAPLAIPVAIDQLYTFRGKAA